MYSPTESRRIENILASISDCFYALDSNWRFTYLNPQAEAYFGIKREEIFGRNILEVFPHARNSIFIREFERVSQNGGKSNFKAQSAVTQKWVDFTVYAQPKDVALPDGGGGIAVFFRDITPEIEARQEAQRVAQELEESRRQLEDITRTAQIAVWRWNVSRDEMLYVFNLEAAFGFEISNTQASQGALARMHPDDVPIVRAMIQDVVARGEAEYNPQFRLARKDGADPNNEAHWRWVLQRALPSVNENGDVILTGFISDITRHKQIEKALDVSKSALQKVASEAGVAIWLWEPERDFIHEKYMLDELFGFEVRDFKTFTRYVHPDDLQPTMEFVRRGLEGLPTESAYRIRQVETPVPDEPSHWKWFLVKATPGRSADGKRLLYGFSIDITQSRIAQENLRRSELRFRSLVNASVTAVWRATPEGLILPEATNSRHYIDLPPNEFAMWGWLEAVHPEDREAARAAWSHCVETGDDFDIEYRLRGPRGFRWMRARGVPVIDSARITEWIGTLDDIHDEKLAAQLREQVLQQEREARLVAEASSRAKDEFLAVVSHELRTPLNAILGWSHLLLAEDLPPEAAKNGLEVIERNARAQAHIVEDILDVARVVTGKLSVEMRPVDLRVLVEDALEAVSALASQKSIALDSQLVAATVNGDPVRLRQVLWNLLSNAIKFTPTGGTVRVSMHAHRDEISVSVQDSGVGIETEFLPHVFDRFRQADSSSTRRYGGLGLGLALVSSLVEAHGGHVEAQSEGVGHGATFCFSLPLVKDLAPRTASPSSLETTRALENQRILVVEDSTDTLELVALMLSREGAHVTPVSNAQTARIALETSAFDLVISDLAMPGQNGYDLLGHIQKRQPNVSVIAMSAFASASENERAQNAGFAAFIAKPIEKHDLLAIIRQVIAKR